MYIKDTALPKVDLLRTDGSVQDIFNKNIKTAAKFSDAMDQEYSKVDRRVAKDDPLLYAMPGKFWPDSGQLAMVTQHVAPHSQANAPQTNAQANAPQAKQESEAVKATSKAEAASVPNNFFSTKPEGFVAGLYRSSSSATVAHEPIAPDNLPSDAGNISPEMDDFLARLALYNQKNSNLASEEKRPQQAPLVGQAMPQQAQAAQSAQKMQAAPQQEAPIPKQFQEMTQQEAPIPQQFQAAQAAQQGQVISQAQAFAILQQAQANEVPQQFQVMAQQALDKGAQTPAGQMAQQVAQQVAQTLNKPEPSNQVKAKELPAESLWLRNDIPRFSGSPRVAPIAGIEGRLLRS